MFVVLLAFHTHTLCDFLLMLWGVLTHKNTSKEHLQLHKLKNTGTGFVSLILKAYCVFLDKICEHWKKIEGAKGNQASSKTMF